MTTVKESVHKLFPKKASYWALTRQAASGLALCLQNSRWGSNRSRANAGYCPRNFGKLFQAEARWYQMMSSGDELLAVELAEEVLSARAAGDGAGVYVHHKHPLVVTWLLRLVTNPHCTFCPSWSGPPFTGNSNRSGHSQTPPTALAGPKSLSLVQFLRFVEAEEPDSGCFPESATAMIHCCVGSYQNTLGSRKSVKTIEESLFGLITGFFA